MRIALWCAAVALGAPAAPLHAQPAASQPWLRVEAAPDACVQEEALRAEILRLLPDAAAASVRVEARAEPNGWSIGLTHPTGERAERSLTALPADCALRTRAVALAITLAVEHAAEAPAAPLSPSGAAPARAPADDDATAPADPTSSRALAWSAEFALGVSVVELPQPAPLLSAALMLELGVLWAVELRALAALRAAETAIADGQLSTRDVGAMLGPCLGANALGGRLFGCTQLELAAVLGRGEGLSQDDDDSALSAGIVLAVAGRWPVSSALFVSARVEGLLRFVRPRYRVLGPTGEVLDTETLSAGGARLLLGIGWRAP